MSLNDSSRVDTAHQQVKIEPILNALLTSPNCANVIRNYEKDESNRGHWGAIAGAKAPELAFCRHFKFTPVAMDTFTAELLNGLISTVNNEPRPSNERRRVESLIRYNLPGIGNASLKELLTIRSNEEAFEKFRNALGKVIDCAKMNSLTQVEHLE
jgi:hypothetical protein